MRSLNAALVLVLAGSLFAQRVQVTMTVQGTGVIAHEKCQKKKADPAQCSAKCPKAGDKLVFVTEKGKAMKIENPEAARMHLGQKVRVAGKIEGSKPDQIHLESVSPTS